MIVLETIADAELTKAIETVRLVMKGFEVWDRPAREQSAAAYDELRRKLSREP